MGNSQAVWQEPWDVKRRLSDLGGLTQEILRNAVVRSQAAFAACTPNYPRNFPGIAGWASAICGLGDGLAPDGWTRVERDGQPLVVSPDGSVALTVATGDENTGKVGEDVQPRTKASKGAVTIEAVKQNAFLFPEMEAAAKNEIEQERKRRQNTWILLTHRDQVTGEVRCELSRPTKMDQDMHIIGWSERIILPPVEFEPRIEAARRDGPNGEQDSGEITIEVKRRV